jgi:hypothetical protein
MFLSKQGVYCSQHKCLPLDYTDPAHDLFDPGPQKSASLLAMSNVMEIKVFA